MLYPQTHVGRKRLKDTEANHCRTNELTYGETFRWTRLSPHRISNICRETFRRQDQAVQKLLKYREALRRQDQCHTNQLKYGETFRGQDFSRTKELTRGETFIRQD